jgi:hypothetical protein
MEARYREAVVNRNGALTQELKLMAVSVTPRLLSWSSSWNLIGNGGAMIDKVARYAAPVDGHDTQTYRKLLTPNEGAVR